MSSPGEMNIKQEWEREYTTKMNHICQTTQCVSMEKRDGFVLVIVIGIMRCGFYAIFIFTRGNVN